MSTAIRELPDCETLIVEHLQADSGLVTAGVKQVVGPAYPNNPDWPMIRIHRFGGVAPFAPWLDGGIVQVDIYGRENTTELRAIAAKVRVSLQEMVGVHDQGVVTGVEEVTGPAYLPDPATSRPRVTWSVRVFAHPRP
jgi:hypothetical protein